jgi:mannose-6-phosphate isomerase-like protein (cupin superfamily)
MIAPRRSMPEFPAFMRNPLNLIAPSSQYTDSIEGYVFDGADGSQVAFWTCHEDRASREHTHDFDEYLVVIEGRCLVMIGSENRELGPGDELVIPKGTPQRMAVSAGTRTMHVFGGRRARRNGESDR